MASQPADTGVDANQVRPPRAPIPSIRGKADRHPAAGILGSHVVLDDGRPRKQAARFQDLLQQPSSADWLVVVTWAYRAFAPLVSYARDGFSSRPLKQAAPSQDLLHQPSR